MLQGFTCPADSGQVCGNTPNPAGSNLNYGYQGFDNFAMLSLVVFQVRNCCYNRAVTSLPSRNAAAPNLMLAQNSCMMNYT